PSGTQRLAQSLQTFTATLASDLSETAGIIKSLVSGDGVNGKPAHQWFPALKALLLTILFTLAMYFMLRMIAKFAFARLNVWILQDTGKPKAAWSGAPHVGTGSVGRFHKFASLALGRKL